MAKVPGSLTKLRKSVLQACEDRGITPVDVLIEFAYAQDPAFRFNAIKELMQYCYPKLKAIEFKIEDIPDEAFDAEVERRVNRKILEGKKIG